MIRAAATVTAFALSAVVSADAQSLIISRGGSRQVRPAPPQNFTGSVQVEMLFEALAPSNATAGTVTFQPGARTAWHTHPRGQILVITAGTGRVQRWGDPIEEVRAGDVVQIPAGQKHWHGASPQASMTHLAITEELDGKRVQWMEQVTDEQYGGAPRAEARTQAPATSQPQSGQAMPAFPPQAPARPSGPLQQKVAPGLAMLTDDVLYGDVWKRPELSPRDRSLVTITALIAIGKVAPLAGHLGRALDNGLTPVEASGLLTHLAIYCGWPSVVASLEAFDQVYTARKIDTAALSAVGPRLPAPNAAAARARGTSEPLAAVAPKFVQLTNDVVFDDLWRRPDLTLRDRSLVTIVALAATGNDDQLAFYLRRGVESGLARSQIIEAVTHLAFYSGWGRATSVMTVVAKTLGQ
jgi:4-carboxymuconolactone decarboxylase